MKRFAQLLGLKIPESKSSEQATTATSATPGSWGVIAARGGPQGGLHIFQGYESGVAAAEGLRQGAAAWQRPLNDWIAREQNPSQSATSGPDPSAWTQLQQTTFSLTDVENNRLRAVRTVATLPCRRQSSSTPDRPARGSGAGALPG